MHFSESLKTCKSRRGGRNGEVLGEVSVYFRGLGRERESIILLEVPQDKCIKEEKTIDC